MRIRLETPADVASIRVVNVRAFGQDAEGRLVDALRAGGHARGSFVAEVDGRVVGHVLYSELAIESARGVVPALALAPLAVLPEHQRHGVGTALVRASLDVLREHGRRIVIVLGHPTYYPRFGFSPEKALPLESEYAGPHFMALELAPGALDGVAGRVRYAAPFAAL